MPEHGGKAASGMLPAVQWLVPDAALPTMARWQAYLAVSVIAVDLSARGYEAVAVRSEAKEAQVAGRDLSVMLDARIAALQGKARGLNQLLDLIAQEPRCS